jgi:hypothetical protein
MVVRAGQRVGFVEAKAHDFTDEPQTSRVRAWDVVTGEYIFRADALVKFA